MAAQITFAIPFHAGLDYLSKAIASLCAQRDVEWQGFVCDNASTEPGAESLVRSFDEPRLSYVRNPRNLGMAGNFNRCIDLAETDLVTLLHADDELLPDYARTVVAASRRYPEAAAFFCRAEIIGPDSQQRFSLADKVKDFIMPSTETEFELRGEPGLRALLKGNFIMAPTLCFRKPRLGERRFSADYKFVLDQELTTDLLLSGEVLVGLPARCYRYRRHESNATEELTRTQQRFREESEFFDRIRTLAVERGWKESAQLAEGKRIIKLNVGYRALKSLAQLQLADAWRGMKLLRSL